MSCNGVVGTEWPYLILPIILEHLVSWKSPNLSRISMRGKPRFTPYQMVTAAHLSPCMAGMNQVHPNLVGFLFLLTLKKWEETSLCLSTATTWPVLRWRMVLHSHFQESLPKCDNHIKGSVPFLPLASPFFFLFHFFLFFFFSFSSFFSFILHSKWGSLAVCSLIEKA